MADDVEPLIRSARSSASNELARGGDWFSGAQRVAVWRESRAADHHPLDRARRAVVSPRAVGGGHEAIGDLSAVAVEVVHRVATDPGRLTRAWADEAIKTLSAEKYTELIGVTAIARVLDTYSVAIGSELVELPEVDSDELAREPARSRPDDVGDVGAWVPQSIDKLRANVSRALSLVPVTDATWRDLVDSHYSRGRQFMELTWNRALSRVQVEAIAARTTAALDCFY